MKRAPSSFIARLRQTRRSAWLLIGLCMLYRAGDALLTETGKSLRGYGAAIAQVQP